MEMSYHALRQKIHRQIRLVCIELIYQRKHQSMLIRRQQEIRQLGNELLVASLRKPDSTWEPMVNNLLRAVSTKLLQKQVLIDQCQSELFTLMGNRLIAFPDTVYPSLPGSSVLRKRANRIAYLAPDHAVWRNRYGILQTMMAVGVAAHKKQKSPFMSSWALRTGEWTGENFLSQLINHYELIDGQMRAERDLHVAAVHLLAY